MGTFQEKRMVPELTLARIAHFFEHYKDLESGKWTHIGQWVDVPTSERLIMEGIERAAKRNR